MMTPGSQTRTVRRGVPRRYDWVAALALLIAGALGLYQIVTTTTPIAGNVPGGLSGSAYAKAFFDSPNVGSIVMLLAALFAATLGGAWFVVRLLHWRFRPAFEPLKVWRQALWAGLFAAAGAWLQLNRSLTIALGALVAGAFVLLEVFLNVRERQE